MSGLEYNDGQIALPSSLADYCQHYSFKNYLSPFYRKRWIIHLAKPTKDHSSVVNYLGRYIKRPPIAQSKLKHYDGNIVIFIFLTTKMVNMKMPTWAQISLSGGLFNTSQTSMPEELDTTDFLLIEMYPDYYPWYTKH